MTAADLVIGIDQSTTATKAIAWSAEGRAVAEGRAPVPLANPGPGLYEQDPDDWWRSAAEALRDLTGKVDPGRFAALAIANQRETFAALDAGGRAVRPAITWLDERCGAEVATLADALGAEDGLDRVHRITGKPRDVTPAAYGLAWMRRHEPGLLDRTALIADVQACLVGRLTGRVRTSHASADPLALFDMAERRWSPDVLDALGLDPGRLPEAVPSGADLGAVTAEAAEATGLRRGTRVVAGGGDGQLAGLGVDALRPERAYLNLGTAVVSGVYSASYAVDRAWRTMGAPDGGFYLESCLRYGTFLVDWFVERVCGVDPRADPGVYARLEREAADVPIGCRGLILVPYWSGVMPPYWQHDARGVILGLSAVHDRGHIYRAVLEGMALEQALSTDAAEARAGVEVEEYVAIGGGAASDLWCRIVADATGRRVRRSATVEASSLGAGMCAAVGAGWFPSFAEAAASMSGRIVKETEPEPANVARYRELRAVYREVHPCLAHLYGRLAAFVAGSPT